MQKDTITLAKCAKQVIIKQNGPPLEINRMGDWVQSPSTRFKHFSDEGERLLGRLRDVVTSPHQVKRLRVWGIQDAAKMVGRTPQSIRQLEGPGKKLGEPTKDENGYRYYTLERIN
jgi:chromosome partitioning protein